MAYTKTTTKSYGSRLKNAVFWTIIWIALFLGSFVVLFNNEWRVDLSTIAILSTPIEQSGSYEWQFVSLSWDIQSDEQIWDSPYISVDDYIFIERISEMYSWKENEETETKENLGGSETTTTTYTYTEMWSENPENSGSFEISDGHENPAKRISSNSVSVKTATINNYNFQINNLRLPKGKTLRLTPEILVVENVQKTRKEIILAKLKAKKEGKVYVEASASWEFALPYTDTYIFDGAWTLDNPEIGDIRISYKVLKSGTSATIFWNVFNDTIVPYIHDNSKQSQIYHLFDKDRAWSIDELHGEYLFMLWVMRFLWFFMMWIGMNMILGVFTTLLAVIPFFARAGRSVIGFVTFIVAFLLSLFTIIIWMIAHNIFLLAWFILLLVIIIGIVLYRKHQNKSTWIIKEDSPMWKPEDTENTIDNQTETKVEKSFESTFEVFDDKKSNISSDSVKTHKEDDFDFTIQ